MISVAGAIARKIMGTSEPRIPASLFYRVDGYSVGDISLDLILNENHEKIAMVTSHPVEKNAEVSDHIAIALRMGSLRALISNFSLSNSGSDSLTEESKAQDLEEASKEITLTNRAQETWEALEQLMDRKELVTIVTSLKVYEDVAITRISTERNENTGDCLEIDISFQKVNKVKLREDKITAAVQPQEMKTTIEQKSANQVNSGQQVATQATPQEENSLFLDNVDIRI